MSAGLLFDATLCIGFGACSAACKEQNDLPLPIEPETTAYTWTTVQKRMQKTTTARRPDVCRKIRP